jgi:hypothetical protein
MRLRVLAAASLVFVTLSAGASAGTREVSIASGVEPRMTPAEVVAGVLERLGPEATVTSVRGLARSSDVTRFEPNGGSSRADDLGPVWLVRVEGRVVAERSARPGLPPLEAETGYVIVVDADGGVLGMGLP